MFESVYSCKQSTCVYCHKVLVGKFRSLSKEQGIMEPYEPVLFRSLTAVNARVRRHAVIVFTDCFPLGSSESRESYSIEEQFKSILVEPEGMIDR